MADSFSEPLVVSTDHLYQVVQLVAVVEWNTVDPAAGHPEADTGVAVGRAARRRLL